MVDDYVTRILNIALSLYCDLHVDTRNRDSCFTCTDEWLSWQKKDRHERGKDRASFSLQLSDNLAPHFNRTLLYVMHKGHSTLSFLKCWTKMIWKSAAVAECIFLANCASCKASRPSQHWSRGAGGHLLAGSLTAAAHTYTGSWSQTDGLTTTLSK